MSWAERTPYTTPARWYLDKVCTTVDGVRHWLVLAGTDAPGHAFVLGIFLQRHRNIAAAKTFLTRLLGKYDIPEGVHTDQLRNYGAAIRENSSPVNVNYQQVILTTRHKNFVEQSHRPTRLQERQQASVLIRASVPRRAVLPKTGAVLLKTATRIQETKTCSRISEPAPPNRRASVVSDQASSWALFWSRSGVLRQDSAALPKTELPPPRQDQRVRLA